jgi:hypothetical protein
VRDLEVPEEDFRDAGAEPGGARADGGSQSRGGEASSARDHAEGGEAPEAEAEEPEARGAGAQPIFDPDE